MQLKDDTTRLKKEEIALGTAWTPQRCSSSSNFFATTFIVVAVLLFLLFSLCRLCGYNKIYNLRKTVIMLFLPQHNATITTMK